MSRTDDPTSEDPLVDIVARILYEIEEDDSVAPDDPGLQRAIERACDQNPDLAEDIRRRLAQLEGMGVMGGHPADAGSDFPQRLGDFRLLRRIGIGGMGVVYRAHQEPLNREVALKLVRPDHLYFPQARERFLREVRAIASLQHPGIVPVYSVGEEAGVPFFAMELVEGRSLAEVLGDLHDQDASSLKGPDLLAALGSTPADSTPTSLFQGSWVETCLRLTLQAAEALAHAHQRNIVHRDIKPSNLMLTADGRVRLLDFGLASSSGSDRLTRTGAVVGSLPYLPPEALQGNRDAVDERSDVYALGVTLFELLTLKLPYREFDRESTRRRILDGHPVAPRKLNAQVSWDAETVCLTAMERDPHRRYESAAHLARDLRNVLELRPIEARRAGPALRARRWVQRHPTLSVALLLALLVLGVGPTVFALQALRHLESVKREKNLADRARSDAEHQEHLADQARADAVDAREEAEAQRDTAKENLQQALAAVDRFLKRVGSERLEHVPHMEELRREFLEDALEFYQRFYSKNRGDPDIEVHAIQALQQVSVIQQLLGDHSAGQATEQQRIQILRQRLTENPADSAARLDLANALNILGVHEGKLGTTGQAETHYLESISLLRQLRRESSAPAYPYQLAIGLNNLGQLNISTGKLHSTLDLFQEAGLLLDDLIEKAPANLDYQNERARCWYLQGNVFDVQGRVQETIDCFSASKDMYDRMAEVDPSNPEWIAEGALARGNLGRIVRGVGQEEKGTELLEEAAWLQEELVEQFPGVTRYRWDLGMTLMNLGAALTDQQRFLEAEEVLEQSRAVQEELVDEFPQVEVYRHELAGTLSNMAGVLLLQEEGEAAYDLILEAIDYQREALAKRPKEPRYRLFLRIHLQKLAVAHLHLGQDPQGAEALEEALSLCRDDLSQVYKTATVLIACYEIAEAEGRPDDQAVYLERICELFEECLQGGQTTVAGLRADENLLVLHPVEEFQSFLADHEGL